MAGGGGGRPPAPGAPPPPGGAHLAAGGCAGGASVLALHPLDVIKTRLQVQDGRPGSTRYPGALGAGAGILRQEGVRGFYGGLTPALVGSTVAWGAYFAVYERRKAARTAAAGGGALGPRDHLLSAAEAGLLATVLTNPVWVVKTRLQLQQWVLPGAEVVGAGAGRAPPAPRYQGPLHCVGTILREEGVAGFYKGMWPSIWLVAHGAIQFTAYEEIKRRIVGLGRAESASQLDTLDASVAGVASKFIATTITYPSQVLRSRLQQNTMGSRAGMYQGTLNALHQTLRNEGVMAFYKGFVPSILRVLPSSAITFAVYEKTLQALRDR